MTQKGFSPIILLIIIGVVVVLGGLGIYFYTQKSQITSQVISTNPSVIPTPSANASSSSELAQAITYTLPPNWQQTIADNSITLTSFDFNPGSNPLYPQAGAKIEILRTPDSATRTVDDLINDASVNITNPENISKITVGGLPGIYYENSNNGNYDVYTVLQSNPNYQWVINIQYSGQDQTQAAFTRASYSPTINAFVNSISFN